MYMHTLFILYTVCGLCVAPTLSGKIQGDGRQFLDRFESYCGSQISSDSLNEVHVIVYRLQPKSATKGEFLNK